MRHFCSLLLFIFVSLSVSSQHIYKIKTDSLLVTNDSCTAELNLENSTKFVNGFLYNKGKGRTEFRRAMIKLTDSTYLFGDDTLNFRSLLNTIGFSGTNIYNSNGTLISNRYVDIDTSSLSFGKYGAKNVHLFNNGNLWIGNTRTPVDSGYRLDVGGNAIIRGALVMEKEASSSGAPNVVIISRHAYNVNFSGYNADANVVIGDQLFRTGTISGQDNILIGRTPGKSITGGSVNILVGRETGRNISTGGGNVFIGYLAGYTNTGQHTEIGNVSRKFLIGNAYSGIASTLMYGDFQYRQLVVNPMQENVPTIHSSIQFGVNSTTGGIQFPRMSSSQRNAIANPALGIVLYQTDLTENLYLNKTTGWKKILTEDNLNDAANIFNSNGSLYSNRFVNLDTSQLSFGKNSNSYFHIFNNGNAWLGNGFPIDANYKLEVNGTVRATALYNVNHVNNSEVSTLLLKNGVHHDGTIVIGGSAIKESGYGVRNVIIVPNVAMTNFTTSAAYNTIVGSGSGQSITTGNANTLIGWGAGNTLTADSYNTLIGTLSPGVTGKTTIMLTAGLQPFTNGTVNDMYPSNQNFAFIGGGYYANEQIQNFYFGPAPFLNETSYPQTNKDVYFHATSAVNSTNSKGGDFTFSPGRGTGTGTGGDLIFNTSTAQSSGTMVQTLAERLRIKYNTGNVLIGTSTDAGYKLDVTGNSRITGILQMSRGGYNSIWIGTHGNAMNMTENWGVNVVIGSHTSSGTISTENVLIGHNSGKNLSGSGLQEAFSNVIVGSNAGHTFTTGGRNVIIGSYAGYASLFNAGNGSDKLLIGSGGNGIGGHILGGDILNGNLWVNPLPVNISSPDPSVAFGINATNTNTGGSNLIKGFLPPKWTLSQRSSINSPATGLIGYQTDNTENLYINKSTGWKKVLTEDDSPAILSGSFSIDFNSTNAGTATDITVTLNGAAEGDVVSLGAPNSSVITNTCFTAWVSAADTVTIRFNNYSGNSADPAIGTFKIKILK